MKEYLTDLGATQILTYDDLDDKTIKQRVSEWTGGEVKLSSQTAVIYHSYSSQDISLLLNCVGDKTTTKMLRLLGNGAQVITYGAMSKAPLPVPPGALIFQDITFRGFWQSHWYAKKSSEERAAMTQELVKLISDGKVCSQGTDTTDSNKTSA
jgi:NADPH:quinone reductase-like Zn-dependent oxidoreductase